MPLNSPARRSSAALIAAFLIAGACTTPGTDKSLAPGRLPNAPSLDEAASAPVPVGLVISQIYGGGGNSGATLKNDFIELYNGSFSDVSLDGMSVQYASAAGFSWQVTPLSGTLRSGQYYLVQESAGAGGTVALPAADATDGIAMSATAGKVALVNDTTPLTVACPIAATDPDPGVIDFVGFGTTASCFEGSAPTGATSNTNAAIRADSGMRDNDDNKTDFSIRAPSPRNSASPILLPVKTLQVKVAPAAQSVHIGNAITFSASATFGHEPIAISSTNWTSSKTDIATIDASSGAVSTLKTGTTTISVTVTTTEGSKTASTTLTVSGDPATVAVSPTTATVQSGKTTKFTAVAKDASGNVAPTTITWSASDPSVVAIDASTGIATGRALGTATITATTANNISATAKITVTAGTVTISSRSDTLPVGFQTQLFVNSGSADAKGNAVDNTNVVWSSSNPAIVSVNPSTGVITANAAGTAVIKATATTDGASSGSTTIKAGEEAVSPNARVGHNTELGVPTDGDPSDDVIIARRQYTLSYNVAHGGPNWVSWNLDATHQGGASRCNCMTADTALTRLGIHAFDTNDWINGGIYSRGHMSPSADWADTPGDNAPTFFLSNMIPQNQTANAGAWGSLENYLRTQTGNGEEIYIVAGPIFTKNRSGAGVDGFGWMTGTGHIAVPDSMWKVAVIVPDARSASQIGVSDVRVIAVNMENSAVSTGDWSGYKTTVAKIEQSTGYDLLSILPPNVQCRLETRDCAPVAKLTGSGLAGGNEGSTLSFSAATSSDADADDAITYAWSIDGQPAGSSATLTHTFADNGDYAVRVIVADGQGAADTASASVHVSNVAPTVAAFAGATILQGETYTAAVTFTDPGADTWRASANFGDGSATVAPAISDKSFTLEHRYTTARDFTVTVSVLDKDGGMGTRTASVVVQSPVQGIANISDMLSSLGNGLTGATTVSAGARTGLNAGQLNSLRVKLNAAAAQLEQGNANAASNILEAFLNELDAAVKSGRVSSGAAQPVADYTQRVITSIGG